MFRLETYKVSDGLIGFCAAIRNHLHRNGILSFISGLTFGARSRYRLFACGCFCIMKTRIEMLYGPGTQSNRLIQRTELCQWFGVFAENCRQSIKPCSTFNWPTRVHDIFDEFVLKQMFMFHCNNEEWVFLLIYAYLSPVKANVRCFCCSRLTTAIVLPWLFAQFQKKFSICVTGMSFFARFGDLIRM